MGREGSDSDGLCETEKEMEGQAAGVGWGNWEVKGGVDLGRMGEGRGRLWGDLEEKGARGGPRGDWEENGGAGRRRMGKEGRGRPQKDGTRREG